MKVCLSEPMFQRLEASLAAMGPDLELVRLQPDGTYVGDPAGIDVFCFSVDLASNPDSLAEAGGLLSSESLEWVQAPGAGVEHAIWAQLLDRGVRLTPASSTTSSFPTRTCCTRLSMCTIRVSRSGWSPKP